MNLTAVVPFYNGHETLRKLVESLPAELPIIVVDDRSPLPLERQAWMGRNLNILTLEHKGYFAGAVNAGIAACRTDVLVLNQDTWFDDDRWFALVDDRRNEGYAMVGERIAGQHPTFGKMGYIHGTFMFLRRDALDKVGLLNEKLYPLWGNTAELQLRMARQGYAALPLPSIPGFHHARPLRRQFGSGITELLAREPEKRELLTRIPPLLSVVVPCYNYGRYLPDCIHSLIGGQTSLGEMPGQTLQSFEVVIVNDASTDNSAQYVDRMVNHAQGIRAYHLEHNVGTAKALNFGIQRSMGKYITFLSADDMREPWSLEKLVQACEENPHSFAYDDVWLFNRHQKIKAWHLEDYDFETLLWKNQVHAGIVFPKRAWEEVGGYPGIMGDGREDWAFNVALGIHGWCGVHVRELGYLYRREDQNRSITNTTPQHRERFLQKLKGLFPDVYGGYRPMACCGKGGARSRAAASASLAAKQALHSMTTLSMTGGTQLMASAGSEGMTRLEYTGRQMTAIWDGPVTRTRYRFGADHRVRWVDRRDVGERGRSGFLALKDRNGNFLFQLANDGGDTQASEAQPEGEPVLAVTGAKDAVSATVVEGGEEVLTAVADPATQEDAVSVTVVEEASAPSANLGFADPATLYPSDIKQLDLTKEQWGELYRLELAGKNRKTVITFVEEKLASE